MKKFILFIIIIALISIVIGLLLLQNNEQEEVMEGSSNVRKTFSIVGTGTDINDGVIASSTASTFTEIFQFASSTTETWWDTANNWPNFYGSTSTVRFLNEKADLITVNGVFKGLRDSSFFIFEIAGSNDASCNSASVGVNWYPIPTPRATSTLESSIIYNDNAITVSPGSTASTTFAFTLEDINYDCTKLTFYNNSTTDESLLYVEVSLKKIN